MMLLRKFLLIIYVKNVHLVKCWSTTSFCKALVVTQIVIEANKGLKRSNSVTSWDWETDKFPVTTKLYLPGLNLNVRTLPHLQTGGLNGHIPGKSTDAEGCPNSQFMTSTRHFKHTFWGLKVLTFHAFFCGSRWFQVSKCHIWANSLHFIYIYLLTVDHFPKASSHWLPFIWPHH